MLLPKLSIHRCLWLIALIAMLVIGVPRWRMMRMRSVFTSPHASLAAMSQGPFRSADFPERFLEKVKALPKDRAILVVNTPDTDSAVASLIFYMAWPRPVVVRTVKLRDAADVAGLLRQPISALVMVNQEMPPGFQAGERLSPGVTYISREQVAQ